MSPKRKSSSAAEIVRLRAKICRQSYEDFVREFWEEVPGAGAVVWNWHMSLFCSELQAVAEKVFKREPREHDVICNVSPGTSKSSLWSILFPCWLWTRMPSVRILSASHTHELVLDLSNKSRHVVRGEKYREHFPGIDLVDDQDTKGYYRNSAGGARMTCTVAGKSPMGFHADFLVCLPWESRIITDRGILPIGRVVEERLSVKVMGYDHELGSCRWQTVELFEESEGKSLCRIVFSDGSFLEATGDHPLFVEGRGYIPASEAVSGDEVIHVEELQILRQWDYQEEVSWMRGDDFDREEPVEDEFLLQCFMSGEDSQRGKTLAVQSNRSGVQLLRSKDKSDALFSRSKAILFSELCQQSPFRKDERQGKSELHSRERSFSVFGGVCKDAEEGPSAGELLLLPMWDYGEREWAGLGCSSHRLGQEQQPQVESRLSVSSLSYESSGKLAEATSRGKKIVVFVERAVRLPKKVYNLRTREDHNYFANGVLVHNCDDPIDPKKAVSEVEIRNAKDFMLNILPTRKTDKRVSVTLLIMQRLHREDPTGVLLENAKKQDAASIRHICLPAELGRGEDGSWLEGNVSPKELSRFYIEGLMDPQRLGREALREYRATLGAYGYAGQFEQNPTPLGGGMFKAQWFSQTVRAAPYHAKARVRFWDRAATADGGCYTAGVLGSIDEDNKIYVEHVVHGQWEPNERNDIIMATAERDRSRYSPNQVPTVVIEAERGSTGLESFQNIARRLVGFRIREDLPTGSKDVRAEPWADQLAARNVWLVEDGTWDIAGYVQEHILFRPDSGIKRLGKWKDQVDASAGMLRGLIGARQIGTLRVLPIRDRGKEKGLRIVVCSESELASLEVEPRCLLVSIQDPLPVEGVMPDDVQEVRESGNRSCLSHLQFVEVNRAGGNGELTGDGSPSGNPAGLYLPHCLGKLLDSLTLRFADLDPADHQATWEEPVEPWGKPAHEIAFGKEIAKRLWSFLLRKRDPAPDVVVIQDSGDKRAESIACGIADAFHLPRSIVHIAGNPDKAAEPGNKFVYDLVKAGRGSVV